MSCFASVTNCFFIQLILVSLSCCAIFMRFVRLIIWRAVDNIILIRSIYLDPSWLLLSFELGTQHFTLNAWFFFWGRLRFHHGTLQSTLHSQSVLCCAHTSSSIPIGSTMMHLAQQITIHISLGELLLAWTSVHSCERPRYTCVYFYTFHSFNLCAG